MAAVIQPLSKTSLVDEVASALREQVTTGGFQPGQTLHIEALAREFGVSRTPIREAFSRLESEGMLVRRPGHAATVFAPLRREVREYYEMRSVLEPLAARLALPNVTAEIEHRLVSLLTRMDDFAARDWYEINGEFHRLLYEASGRLFLVGTIENLVQRSNPYIRVYFKTHDLWETQRGHREIVTAISRRDESALVTAVEAHLNHALSEIVAVIPGENSE